MRRLAYTPIFLIMGWLCYEFLSPRHYQRQQPFSQSAWLNADPEQRGSMARDLVRSNHLTPSSTMPQVLELLGKPDSQSENYLYYNVGYMGMNSHWPMAMTYGVSIQFDDADHFKSAYIHD